MSSIFISHSSRDGGTAAELRERLVAEGHRSVFLEIDPAVGIPAGRSWEQELYARLRACRAVIVLCSEHSMASDWVFAEITHAKALGKHVFPLRVAPCEIRSLLTDVQVIDVTTGPEEAYDRLWRGLRLAGLDPKNQFDWDGSRPPYPGLLAFQEDDAAIFFGRSGEISEGLGSLHRMRSFGGAGWILVLGGSGSGKSSLVRAGLLPRLRRDPDSWVVVGPFRPLGRPFDELARALSRAFDAAGEPRSAEDILSALRGDQAGALGEVAGDLLGAANKPEAGVLMVLDQVEELLRSSDDDEADRFLATLRAASESDVAPVTVLGTLRSDFLGDFQACPVLRELAFSSISVGPLSVDGFAEVIEGPAELAGIELEAGLVQAMVADTETDDALPLLAFTLREQWESYCDDQKLTLSDYRDRLGGLDGSVARAAEAAVGPSANRPKELAQLRSALLAMVRINAEGSYVRQPADWSDLPAGSHEALGRFIDARLMIAAGDGEERRLEVAHEALLRVWTRLVEWLDEDRAFLLWRKRVSEAQAEWQRTGRRRGYLLRGPALGEAVGWLKRRSELLPEEEQGFIRASARADRLRRYRVVALLAAVAVALALFGLRAETQRRRAERMRVAGTDVSRLISARNMRKFASINPFMAGQLNALSARSLLSLERPSLFVHVMDIEDPSLGMLGASPDLMVAGLRSPAGLEIRSIIDPRWRMLLEHPAPVYALAIESSPPRSWVRPSASRGRYVLTAANDGAVRLFQLPDLRPVAAAILEEADFVRIEALLGSGPDGQPSFEAELLVEFPGHDERVSRLAFSPSGDYAVSLSGHETAIWRTGSGAEPPLLGGHEDRVTGAAFSSDGRRLVTTSEDRRALVWNLGDPFEAPRALEGHGAGVVSADFSPDSQSVLTVAADREIRLWSAAGGEGSTLATVDCPPIEIRYTAVHRHAAVACADGSARILDIETGRTWRFE